MVIKPVDIYDKEGKKPKAGVENRKEMITRILQDHIHSMPTTPFTADWASLISAAKRHEVSAILYAQCKDFIPEPFLADLKRYHSTVLYFYANRRKLTGRVEEALRGMEHFTIKGA